MPKNIVVCCDGTGNEYGPNNTNVVKLYEAIVRDADQVAFYDPGVGTFSFLGRRSPVRFRLAPLNLRVWEVEFPLFSSRYSGREQVLRRSSRAFLSCPSSAR